MYEALMRHNDLIINLKYLIIYLLYYEDIRII